MSLRWKAFLLLLTVLAVVHAGLAYNGYANLRNQYQRQALDDFARHRASLDALLVQAARDAQEQARALAAVAAIGELSWVGELFFGFSTVRYYGDRGELLAEWELTGLAQHPAGREREARLVDATNRSGQVEVLVECSAGCKLRTTLPAFERGGRKVVVAASYALEDTLAHFERLSGTRAALTVPGTGETFGWLHGRALAAFTDAASLAETLREAGAPQPAGPGIETTEARGRTLMFAFQPLPVRTADSVEALIVADQTARLATIAVNQRNYIALALFGLVLATGALFMLLTPSLRRLGHITAGLPLLAEQKFADARALFALAARRGGISDEIDRLNTSALALADRLQELMGAEAASEAKSQFLAAMSHEIRTPINGLLGLLELHAETELSDSQRESVRIMRDSALTLLAVVDDVLDFSKVEAGKVAVHPAPTSLREVVEGALETLAASASSKGLRLVCYVPPELPAQVIVDPVRVRQVLLNLCSNAIKFTAEGQVAVTLESPDARANPVRVRCTVRDTGIGIAPDARGRLFKPFSQAEASTTRSYGGTGLGLSICRGLMEVMGGKIGFTSAPGQGSAFWFELDCPVADRTPPTMPSLHGIAARLDVGDPAERGHLRSYLESAGARVTGGDDWQVRIEDRAHNGLRLSAADGRNDAIGRPVRYLLLLREVAQLCGRAPAPAALAPARPAPRAQHGRVLVAEDHPTNRRVIRQQLEHLGFQSDIVEDGHQALEKLAPGRYALLITDLHMPGLDGIGLAREVRAREAADGRRPLPIIGLTADVLPAAVERCREAGMNDVLRKPVAMAELGRTLALWVPDDAPGPAIDRRLLAQVLGTDDAAVVRETLDDFLRIAAQHMAELLEALRQGDEPGVQRLAHRMSGSARTVGALRLADTARELERAAQQGRAAHLPELHEALCADFEGVRREAGPGSGAGSASAAG